MLFDLPKELNKLAKISKMKFRIYIAILADVLQDTFPAPVGATISSNVLQENKTFKFLDCKVDTVKPVEEPGENPYTSKLKLTPVIEGVSKATLGWLRENLGKEVVVVWERCSDGAKFIGGSPCSNGLTIKLVSVGAQDGAIEGIALSFEGGECIAPFSFYDADVVLEDPTVVTLGAGTTFAIGAGSQYTMTDNAAAKSLTDITGVDDDDIGRIIELNGAGVNNPTLIEASDKFILNAGLSFSATLGSRLSLFVTKTDDGYAFFEVFRA
jgi:hypothetical protein